MDAFVNVMDYATEVERAHIMAGTLEKDVSEVFTAALMSGRPVYVPNGDGWAYQFGSTVALPSNSVLFSDGALIVLADGVNNHVLRIDNGASNIVVRGLRINGNKDNNTGGNGVSMGGTGGGKITIREMDVFDCSAHGIYIASDQANDISISGNRASGCYSGGITIDETVLQFSIENNHCWLNGTHGVGVLGIGKHGAIVGNVCWDNGQGDPNADNLTGYNAGNDNLSVTGNVCYGCLNNGIHFGGSRITITGNTSYGATQYGIALLAHTGSGDDCVVSSNVSYDNGKSGYWIKNCNSGVVSGNIARDNTEHGFFFDNCTNIAITGNTSRGNGLSGFSNNDTSSWLAICGNTSRSNADHGLNLSEITDSTVTGNVFESNSGWGINVAGSETRNIINSNIVRSNTVGQIDQVASTTRVNDNETGTTNVLASASTLTLPPGGEYFYVTGTTNITSITATFVGRRLTMQFDDALTVTNGSNLRMAGNFTTTYKDTLSLVCDGTNWIETSRSVN